MSLGAQLVDVGYTALYQRGAPHPLLRDEDALAAVAVDGAEDDGARFLAAEAVLPRQTFEDDERAAVAAVYARALRGQFTGAADEWRTPEGLRGRAGENVLALGTAAVGPLAGLLDDESPVHYEGSRTATAAAIYGYRVKDLAAGLLADLRGESFPAVVDAGERDAAIERMRGRLG